MFFIESFTFINFTIRSFLYLSAILTTSYSGFPDSDCVTDLTIPGFPFESITKLPFRIDLPSGISIFSLNFVARKFPDPE